MALTPRLHAPNLIGSAEVVAIVRLAPPASLTGDLASALARRVRTEALVLDVAVVGSESPPATQALTADRLEAHRDPKQEEKGGRLNPVHAPKKIQNSKKEEELEEQSSEENAKEENQLLNRRITELRDRR